MRGPERTRGRHLLLAFALILVATSCQDLDITNPNQPDRERALSTPEDVEALVSGAYYLWFSSVYGGCTSGLFLSGQAFQHLCVWDNCRHVHYSAIPRKPIAVDPGDGAYLYPTLTWQKSYRAISVLANGLKALENPEVAQAIGPEGIHRLQTFGKFVQGLAHGTVALYYDRGFILDETTDQEERGVPVDYGALMEVAFRYFDEAIELAGVAGFTIPFEWMQAELTSGELVRLIHSYRARLRAQVARTPEERAAVDWEAVIADVDQGLQSTLTLHMDWTAGWSHILLSFAAYPQISALPYFIYGMADQSGAVAEWYDLDLEEKHPVLPDGRPLLIVTPDLRFPQGSTVEEQRAQGGAHFDLIADGESNWKASSRGTWRWSWYKPGWNRGGSYDYEFDLPEITLEELRLLKAEGLYRRGDLAEAAAIVNETRTRHGLSPTDASGPNASCVPKLPNGECGDLWEMLKWEKRMEGVWTGMGGVNWYFDGRGWGDLWKDTPLQFPIPCLELEVLHLTPCSTFGGPGGEMSAPMSTYRFRGEEG